MKHWFAPLAAVLLLHGVAHATELLRPADVAAWLQNHPSAVLVDIRTQPEFDAGHIHGVEHIIWGASPTEQREFERRIRMAYNADRPILLICRSGRRSSNAARLLEAAGFSRVADLRGGMLAWAKADKPVNTPTP